MLAPFIRALGRFLQNNILQAVVVYLAISNAAIGITCPNTLITEVSLLELEATRTNENSLITMPMSNTITESIQTDCLPPNTVGIDSGNMASDNEGASAEKTTPDRVEISADLAKTGNFVFEFYDRITNLSARALLSFLAVSCTTIAMFHIPSKHRCALFAAACLVIHFLEASKLDDLNVYFGIGWLAFAGLISLTVAITNRHNNPAGAAEESPV